MLNYSLTEQAGYDLENITDYTLKSWGFNQVEKYLNGFAELAKNLSKTPNLGKNCNDLVDNLLCFPYESHIIYYVKKNNDITIIRILHKRMDISNRLFDCKI